MNKVVAVVIAQNEEASIRPTLSILNTHKKNGLINEIIVVNDASRDKTAIIAKEMGAKVFSHKGPKGKRGAFVTGALKAKEVGARTMLVLDADILELPSRTVKKLVSSVKDPKKCLMATAQQYENFGGNVNIRNYLEVGDRFSNAQRAINLVGLEPLFRGNKKWSEFLKKSNSEHRWGLEFALDRLLPKNKSVHLKDAPVYTRRAYAKDKNQVSGDLPKKQAESRNFLRRLISSRNALALSFRNNRKRR